MDRGAQLGGENAVASSEFHGMGEHMMHPLRVIEYLWTTDKYPCNHQDILRGNHHFLNSKGVMSMYQSDCRSIRG